MFSAGTETSAKTSDTVAAVVMLLSALQLSSTDHANLASSLLSDNLGVASTDSQAKPKSESSISSLLSNKLGVASTDSQAKPESESSISSDEEAHDDEEPAATITSTTSLTAGTNTSTNIITIIDPMDGYANADAALAFGSILNVHKGVYFNVPITPTDGIPVYYVTRGHKIGVFSGWSSVGPWVTGVSGVLYAKAKTVDMGIEIVVAAIEAGIAVRQLRTLPDKLVLKESLIEYLLPLDIPLDQPLTPEQSIIEAKAWNLRKQCLLEKFRNDYSGSKAGQVANSTNTGAINKMVGRILKKGSGEKTSRILKPWEMYSKTHYTAKVKDRVMAERSSQPVGKSAIHLITQCTKKAFEEESEEVRAAVFAAVEAMKEKKCAEIEEVKEQSDTVSKDIYVSKIALILSRFFEELHEMTDWVFTVLMGGLDPAMGGALDVSSFHVAEAAVLARAQGSLPSTPSSSGLPRTAAMTPSRTNAETIGTDTSPILSWPCAAALSAPQSDAPTSIIPDIQPIFSGPTPLPTLNTASQIPLFNHDFMFNPDDNHSAVVPEAPNHSLHDVNFFSDFTPNLVDTDEGMELMRPLLPMPPQSPNTMSASPSLLQLLQGPTLEPHLGQDLALRHDLSSSPHICYQFQNLGGMTTDHEDVSMGAALLPASASVHEQTAPFPALPLVPSLSVSVPEQTVPLPALSPASVSVVPPQQTPLCLPTQAQQATALEGPSNTANPLEQPHRPSKCQKTKDAVTKGDGRLPPIENGPELEGGCGKHLQFQSKHAAAANDIGQIQASRKGKSTHYFWDVVGDPEVYSTQHAMKDSANTMPARRGKITKDLSAKVMMSLEEKGPNQKEGLMGDKKQGTRSREPIQQASSMAWLICKLIHREEKQSHVAHTAVEALEWQNQWPVIVPKEIVLETAYCKGTQ
ncbi:hypothetical protein BDR05DRAFT_949822 [Suillus weaverae]|nr:hypothetical protein BDR05DRAFT_949822 [Suillus weaverae]